VSMVESEEKNEDEEDCGECEKLKQLIFQAKEAIDDLKGEMEEWKEIAAAKDSQLRALQHKLSIQLGGIDKKVDFDENVERKEFDAKGPVSQGGKKGRNFIRLNKKRIRSRSSHSKGRVAKSSLKRQIKDDEDLFWVEDQGIQTSFYTETLNSPESTKNTCTSCRESKKNLESPRTVFEDELREERRRNQEQADEIEHLKAELQKAQGNCE